MNIFVAAGNSIQDAIDSAGAGDTIILGDGVFHENIIVNKTLTIRADHTGAATIEGDQEGTQLGAIQITPNVDDVVIQGLVVIGIDGSPGLEKAAIYLQGSHDGIQIIDNVITANGDAGLMSEFSAAVTNLLVDGNTFDGQTFAGTQPGGIGFANQFTQANVPRQLVVLGNGNTANPVSHDITFSNNAVSGTTGGISSDDNTTPQGNSMVTIDAADTVITNNDFTGTTAGSGYGLRARGPNTDITDNFFDNTEGGDTRGVFINDQGHPGSYSHNVFAGGGGADGFVMTPGNDDANGGNGADTLFGLGGQDNLEGGQGDDVMDGGAGTDVAFVAEYEGNAFDADDFDLSGLTVLASGAVDGTINGPGGLDTLHGIEVISVKHTGSFATNTIIVLEGMSLQAAIDAAGVGDTILLGDGVHTGNVLVTKAVTIGALHPGQATLDGNQAGSQQGTIEIATGVDNVVIRDLTILGLNGNGASERAAIYITGTGHDGIQILNNTVTARGDEALLTEYGTVHTNMVIDGNTFDGKTFEGSQPGGIGSSTQFNPGNNVPRPLVVINSGDNPNPPANGITFTHNTVSGTTGGISSDDNTSEQGNYMVIIDGQNVSIDNNDFTGITARFATAIRARGPNIDITNNNFDNSGGGDSRGVELSAQGHPGAYDGNVFTGGGGVDRFNMSPGDDSATGAGGNDILYGAGGNDGINGGGGVDTAYYVGASTGFAITVTGANTATVHDTVPAGGDEGTDTLTNVERVSFVGDSKTINLWYADDDTGTAVEHAAAHIDVLANDGDLNNDGLVNAADTPIDPNSVEIVGADSGSGGQTKTVAGEGVWTVSPTGPGGRDILVFTPESGFGAAPSAVSYTVGDTTGARSLPAEVVLGFQGVNDAPSFTSSAAFSIPENSTAVGTVAASDPEGDALTYAIVGGADAGKFTINATTGALKFVTAPNFEAPTDAGANNVYNLVVSASDGEFAPTQNVAVTVTNVVEGPTTTFRVEAESLTRNAGFTVQSVSGSSAGSVIRSNGATEQRASQAFTGSDGVYDVVIGHYDENDGVSSLSLKVNGVTVDSFLFNQELGNANANNATKTTHTTTGVTIHAGDLVELTGFGNGGEALRVDYLDFTRTGEVSGDTASPTASGSSGNVTTAGGTSHTVTVTYADNVAVDVSSIDVHDITVTGAGGPLTVASVSVSAGTDGTPRTATYTVLAPGGSFDSTDNGFYVVALQGGQVVDLSGNAAAANAALTGFSVSVAPPPSSSFRVQAESFSIDSGFSVQSLSVASAGAVLKANGSAQQSASHAFAGADGLYNVNVGYFDENDGVASLSLVVNGTTVDTWLWNQNLGSPNANNATKATHAISGVAIETGDVVKLVGFSNAGEALRVDYVDFTRTGDINPPSGEPFRLEAESLTLNAGFTAQTLNVASGGSVIRANGAAEQRASTVFSALAGTYAIDLGYFDENDGAASMTVKVNGVTVDSWVWNAATSSPNANNATRAEHAISGVQLESGDLVEVTGFQNGGEALRLDYLDFTRTGDLI